MDNRLRGIRRDGDGGNSVVRGPGAVECRRIGSRDRGCLRSPGRASRHVDQPHEGEDQGSDPSCFERSWTNPTHWSYSSPSLHQCLTSFRTRTPKPFWTPGPAPVTSFRCCPRSRNRPSYRRYLRRPRRPSFRCRPGCPTGCPDPEPGRSRPGSGSRTARAGSSRRAGR